MAVALNNHNAVNTGGTSSPVTVSFSVTNAGSNRCAVVRIACAAGSIAATSEIYRVTYGGIEMTRVGWTLVETTTNITIMAMFVLANPPTGSNNLQIFFTGTPATTVYTDLTSYTGVDQQTPVRAGSYQAKSIPSNTTLSLTLNSATGDMTTTCTSCTSGGSTVPTTNQTSRSSTNAGATNFTSDDANGAATVTHTWTYGTPGNNEMIFGFSISQPIGPMISAQPQSAQVYEQQTATFSVTAATAGTGLSYQWQDDSSGSFANISGATSSTLSVMAYLPMSGRHYQCVLSDSIGNRTSNAVTLIVVPLGYEEFPNRPRGKSGGMNWGLNSAEWW